VYQKEEHGKGGKYWRAPKNKKREILAANRKREILARSATALFILCRVLLKKTRQRVTHVLIL
jgi:hypothetical protein